MPIVSISNSLTTIYPLEFSADTELPIASNGLLVWTIIENPLTSCPIDTRFYPFDVQQCEIELTFYSMTTDDLRIDIRIEDGFILQDLESGGKWELIDARHFMKEHVGGDERKIFNKVHYQFLFRRRPMFYIINIILPVIFLSMTTTVVFLLPAEAGEKMGVSITVLLAYSVYLSIISDDLPQKSTSVCYLQVYLTSLLGITALGVMFSVLVLKVHHRQPDVPIGWRTRQFMDIAGPLLCLSRKKPRKDDAPTSERQASSSKDSKIVLSALHVTTIWEKASEGVSCPAQVDSTPRRVQRYAFWLKLYPRFYTRSC